ncbi:CGNR zinc finger domain-containing protein [uncultured Amnibacterium sp.]|uniref:CGNR zinc finger domain-containing protein n=1 Tax=uncultured Amnibacterium sp. TaxID=1631851 RepID=UPI0035C96653
MTHGVRNKSTTMGSAPLDLVDTVFDWEGASVDRIDGPAAWRVWLVEAGLRQPATEIDDRQLARMRDLRESIYAVATAMIAGLPAPEDAVVVVNEAATAPYPTAVLVVDERGLSARLPELGHDDVLTDIARRTVDLFTAEHRSRLRACEDEGCPALFFDNSPAGDRRWCSPQCGARASSREYRARRRAAALVAV